jgi:hypothetical protein
MPRTLATLAVILLGVAVTLAAVGALYLITGSVAQMGNPVTRALATAAALAVGVALLVAAVFISVKLAVLVGVRPYDPPPPTARIDVRALREQVESDSRR